MPPTLADYVETALINLGGKAHLSKIYPEVRRLLTEGAEHIRTNLKAGIREVLERHSAESEGIVKLTHHKLRQPQDIVSKTTSEYSMGWLGPSATS